ncbi:MAG: SAM-dependent methyltransferase, partial [Gemmatimonadota bacterium]
MASTPTAVTFGLSNLAASARVHNGERILDVGCGYGASGRWLSRRLDASVLGITISRRQADLAS